MPSPPPLRRGDVVGVLFRNVDPRLPPLPRHGRPALIVQDPAVQGPHLRWVMASFTTNLEDRGTTRIPVHRDSPEAREMGIMRESLLCLDDLETIPPWRVLERTGHCPFMDEVDRILRKLIALP